MKDLGLKFLVFGLLFSVVLGSLPQTVFAQTPSPSAKLTQEPPSPTPTPTPTQSTDSTVSEVLQNLIPPPNEEPDAVQLELSTPQIPSIGLRGRPRLKKLFKNSFRAGEKVSITVQNADILEIDAKLEYSDG